MSVARVVIVLIAGEDAAPLGVFRKKPACASLLTLSILLEQVPEPGRGREFTV